MLSLLRKDVYKRQVCLHSKLTNTMAIGVAVGDSPTGPFKDAIGLSLIHISAIPLLINSLELSGCIVTIDAMGCQKDITPVSYTHLHSSKGRT